MTDSLNLLTPLRLRLVTLRTALLGIRHLSADAKLEAFALVALTDDMLATLANGTPAARQPAQPNDPSLIGGGLLDGAKPGEQVH